MTILHSNLAACLTTVGSLLDQLLFALLEFQIQLEVLFVAVVDNVKFSLVHRDREQVGQQRTFVEVEVVAVFLTDFLREGNQCLRFLSGVGGMAERNAFDAGFDHFVEGINDAALVGKLIEG